MNILVHAKKGYVVTAVMKDGKVSVKSAKPVFEEGKEDSTIPNAMATVARLLANMPEGQHTVAVCGAVADKINSDFLVKEFRAGKIMSNNRQLSAIELDIYKAVIDGVKKTYGDTLIQSEGYISHSLKPGQTAEQVEWANLYMGAKKVVDGITAPAPTVADGATFNVNEPDEADLAI